MTQADRARRLVRVRTGTDISAYKDSAILRRIKARAKDFGLAEVDAYLARVEAAGAEADAEAERLLASLRVGVSGFFRDPQVFAAFEEVVCPALFRRRVPTDPVRAWSAACSRGQEPYSVAARLLQAAARTGFAGEVRVLGTDVDQQALEEARRGVYPARALSGLPPQLVADTFENLADERVSVRPEIRAAVRFRVGDVLDFRSHPSGMDLIFCRNLLIYLRRAVQEDILLAFHRALRPGGYLVLGASETILGRPWGIFEHVDPARRIYRKPLDSPEFPAPE